MEHKEVIKMKFAGLKKMMAAGLVAVMAAVAFTGCGGDDKAAQKQFLNIGTGGTAGTYYPLGGAMAEILNKAIPGMNASAQSTGASVANINMLKDGSVDLAIVQNDITYYAVNGTEMFKDKKVDGLQGVAILYPETCQAVTLESSGIKDLSQLKGKRVAVGAAGSGVEANARQIMEAYGIAYDDIQVQYLSFSEAASALKDGNVDVAFLTAGYPTAAVQDISSQNKVRLLPVAVDKADALIAKYPFYTKTVIPAGTYAGFEEDVPAVSVMAMLVANEKLTEQQGYDIAKSIFSNLDRLQAAHAVGKLITKETATAGMPLKMNAGAEKFFKEK
jgi:TRAP transporter TAXI family solute receptor